MPVASRKTRVYHRRTSRNPARYIYESPFGRHLRFSFSAYVVYVVAQARRRRRAYLARSRRHRRLEKIAGGRERPPLVPRQSRRSLFLARPRIETRRRIDRRRPRILF